MDALSDVLRSARFTGSVLFRAHLSVPWALAAPPFRDILPMIFPSAGNHRLVLFHIVQRGGCWIEQPDEQPLQLEAGDAVLLVQGEGHTLADRLDRKPTPLGAVLPQPTESSAPPVVEFGGGGAETHLVCGAFLFDETGFNPILPALPAALRMRPGEGAPTPWLQTTMEYVISEAESARPGSSSLLVRLSELFFVEAVRSHIQQVSDAATGWPAAMRDQHVGRVLELMHARPSEPWTVAALAQQAGISRSGLAARFVQLLHEPPMQYLSRLRVHLAARMLEDGDSGVATVASKVGYESEAAFSRLFKRVLGSPPATWAQQRRGGDPHRSPS